LRSAVEAGAEVANYLETEKFLWEDQKVVGIVARDEISGDALNIRGRVVVNAAGPWAAHLMDDLQDLRKDVQPVFSRDLSFMVKKRFDHNYGLAVPTYVKDADAVFDRGGRHLFFAPWRDYTLVGVWHKIVKSPPENITVEPDELQAFAEEVNRCYPGMAIDPEGIVRVNTGLTLYGEEAKQGAVAMSFGKRSMLIDHEKDHKVGGLITLIGVRATTARGMAEKTIDLVARKITGNHKPCSTETTPLFGGDTDSLQNVVEEAQKIRPAEMGPDSMTALVGNHGTRYKEVLQIVLERPELVQIFKGSNVVKAEVVYAIRHEMALHLSDVVFRRTDLASGALPEKDVLKECGILMGAELGWSEERTNREISEVEQALPQFS
jgi:glycerol-3-phosphate dehydrogenase